MIKVKRYNMTICSRLPRIAVPVRICRADITISMPVTRRIPGKGLSSVEIVEVNARTLYEAGQHLASCLQERVSRYDLQEALKPLSPMLNDVVAESVGEDFTRQRRNGHTCALPLENIAEVLEIRVSPAHNRVLQFEGGDVGAADNLVGGVHVSRSSMGLRIAHLRGRVSNWVMRR